MQNVDVISGGSGFDPPRWFDERSPPQQWSIFTAWLLISWFIFSLIFSLKFLLYMQSYVVFFCNCFLHQSARTNMWLGERKSHKKKDKNSVTKWSWNRSAFTFFSTLHSLDYSKWCSTLTSYSIFSSDSFSEFVTLFILFDPPYCLSNWGDHVIFHGWIFQYLWVYEQS